MTTDGPGAGPTPVDDGWEPEPDGRPLSERLGGGPVDYFRAVPARFFAWLGGIVFVGGWAVAVYLALANEVGGGLGNSETSYRLQILLSNGLQATLVAGILWGVAAFLWVKVLPAGADERP
ncbi:MAG TPA: hypothetical protein VGN51_25555 [Acidimicrobiia bacterium]